MNLELLAAFGTVILTTFSAAWYTFSYLKSAVTEPLQESIRTQTHFRQEITEIKDQLHSIEKEMHKRLTVKDGTPIEEVIERMAEQFDLFVDRDNFNFILDAVAKYECDTNGMCVRVNEKWINLTGMDLSEAIGNGWMRMIHELDKTRVLNMWEDFIQKGHPFATRFRIVKGSEEITVYSKAFQKREGNQIKLIIGTIEKI